MFSLNITAPSSYYYRFTDITFFIFNLFPIFVNGMSNKTRSFNRYDYNENTQ